ncbi:unnamed protein product [Linum trigynum]|uniref:Uncharacterized protein n=1 Tax=Linum trigynum TaxID=586398 RepID=A0AAV2DWD8_9ROSI
MRSPVPTVQKPLRSEIRRLVPELRVPVDGPAVDDDFRPLGDSESADFRYLEQGFEMGHGSQGRGITRTQQNLQQILLLVINPIPFLLLSTTAQSLLNRRAHNPIKPLRHPAPEV